MARKPAVIRTADVNEAQDKFETLWAFVSLPCYLALLCCLIAILAGFWLAEWQVWRFLAAGCAMALVPALFEKLDGSLGTLERLLVQLGGPLVVGLVGYWSTDRFTGHALSPLVVGTVWGLLAILQSAGLFRVAVLGAAARTRKEQFQSALSPLAEFAASLPTSQERAEGWLVPGDNDRKLFHGWYRPYVRNCAANQVPCLDEDSYVGQMRSACLTHAEAGLEAFIQDSVPQGAEKLPAYEAYVSWAVRQRRWIVAEEHYNRSLLLRRKEMGVGAARRFLAEQPPAELDRIRKRTDAHLTKCHGNFSARAETVSAVAPELHAGYREWCRSATCYQLTAQDFDRVLLSSFFPRVKVMVACGQCRGGKVMRFVSSRCSSCGGSGSVTVIANAPSPLGDGSFLPRHEFRPCPICGGAGGSSRLAEDSCSYCGGTGRVEKIVDNELDLDQFTTPL